MKGCELGLSALQYISKIANHLKRLTDQPLKGCSWGIKSVWDTFGCIAFAQTPKQLGKKLIQKINPTILLATLKQRRDIVYSTPRSQKPPGKMLNILTMDFYYRPKKTKNLQRHRCSIVFLGLLL
ncbi:hypothetical protein JTB14_017085 [Gonioctena quinquepunctata]|nr:hypothetical protein JTB14_017085 [Gonioctena quinquepunctata]